MKSGNGFSLGRIPHSRWVKSVFVFHFLVENPNPDFPIENTLVHAVTERSSLKTTNPLVKALFSLFENVERLF